MISHGSHRPQQEREARGYQWLQAGIIAAPVAALVGISTFVRQETPPQAPSFTQNGVQGPNVRPPVTDTVITRQEQPFHPGSFVAPPQPVLVPPVIRVVVTAQEPLLDRLGKAFLQTGIQGPNVRPPITDTALIRQEQPFHPSSTWQTGIQGPNVRPPTSDTVFLQQEQPYHPGPFFRPSQPTVLPAVIRGTFTTQELLLDRLGRAFVQTGVQGPNVRPPISDTVLLKQEQPYHPLSYYTPGIQGPNVKSPISDFVLTRQELPFHPGSFVAPPQPILVSPVIRSAFIAQEPLLDRLGKAFVQAGVQGPNVRPPISDTVTLRQEQPYHPGPLTVPALITLPPTAVPPTTSILVAPQEQLFDRLGKAWLQAGIQGPDVRVPVSDTITLRQEQPYHPGSFTTLFPIPSVSTPPVTSTIITGQEPLLDRLGKAWTQAGVQGPNVRPPISDTITLRQEQPYHPGPFTTSAFPTPLVFVPPTTNIALTVQEPLLDRLGRAFAQVGVQGPNVRPAISDTITLRQEQPYHPGSFTAPALVTPRAVIPPGAIALQEPLLDRLGRAWLQAGIQGPNVRPAINDTIVTRQEQPREGYSQTRPSIQGPNVRPPVTDAITLRQEQPFHPLSTWQTGVQGPNVEPPVIGTVLVTQAYPDLGRAYVAAGIQPPRAQKPFGDSLFLSQEQPFHPLPTSQTSRQGPDVASPGVVGRVLVRQEQPFHPGPQVWNFPPYISVGPVKRIVITYQEQPYHPLSQSWAFPPKPAPAGAQTPVLRVVVTRQEQPQHPYPYFRGVDKPNNAIPPQPGVPPLQRNLTFDMLGVAIQPNFYTDPGQNRQVITSINYPHGELAPVGWIPVGGFAYPIGNMYNRNVVPDPTAKALWFKKPDIVGGWLTAQENLTLDLLSLQNQQNFFEDPLLYQINYWHCQYYVVGLTPVGANTSLRGLLGVRPYG